MPGSTRPGFATVMSDDDDACGQGSSPRRWDDPDPVLGWAGYTLATALFVGAAGICGYFDWIFFLIPKAVIFPILMFIGLEIAAQSFHATSVRHYAAVALACVPALAYLALITLKQVLPEVGKPFADLRPQTQHWIATVTMLCGGYPAHGGRLRLVRHHPLAPSLGPDQGPRCGAPSTQRGRPSHRLGTPDSLPLGGGLRRHGLHRTAAGQVRPATSSS